MEEKRLNELYISTTATYTKISLYFDYTDDNHHILIPHNTTKSEIADSLIKLAKLIIDSSLDKNKH